MNEALRSFVAERFPEGAGVEELSGDASTRRYFRLRQGKGTAVLALLPEPFEPGELPFTVLRSLLARWGLRVPDLLDADGSRGILLLEDLGDETLQEALKSASEADRVRLYDEALSGVTVLQERGMEGGSAPCFAAAFDVEKLTFELGFFQTHFLEGLRQSSLTPAETEVLFESFHSLSEEIASWPRVVCHRDFHSRNLMLHEGDLCWIDFQDARMGPATYDLASLLRDSYVDLPEDFVDEKADEFRSRVLGEDRDTFRRRFEIVSIQRNLKALGTFGYMVSAKGKDHYLPYIPRTLSLARANLRRHPEFDPMRRVLARHLQELE